MQRTKDGQQGQVRAPGSTSADAYAVSGLCFPGDSDHYEISEDSQKKPGAWASQNTDMHHAESIIPVLCDASQSHQHASRAMPLLDKRESYRRTRADSLDGVLRAHSIGDKKYTDGSGHYTSAYMSHFWHSAGFVIPSMGFVLILVALWG